MQNQKPAALSIRDQLEYAECDYKYLLTITEDKQGLHTWLRMRISSVQETLRQNKPA